MIASATCLMLFFNLGAEERGPWDLPVTEAETVKGSIPKAQLMQEHQDIAVSDASGSASVNIPLLSLPCGRTGVDLSLSCNASGVRKEDVPSAVGLGWSLSGLGAVTRSVNGLPDEWRGVSGEIRHDIKTSGFGVEYLVEIIQGFVDSRLDSYSYSIPGYSGSFVISGRDVIQLPATDLQILPCFGSNNAIDRFEIVKPDGSVWVMGHKEYIDHTMDQGPFNTPEASPDFSAVSQWNVTEIRAPEMSDIITISYYDSPGFFRNCDRVMDMMSYNYMVHSGGAMNHSTSNSGYSQRTKIRSRAIPAKISCRTGGMEFSYRTVTAASVFQPAVFISDITLKNPSGKEVKKVTLGNSGRTADDRQRLDSLKITSGTRTLESYTFSYYSGTASPGFDIFGFANGTGSGGLLNHSVTDRYLKLSAARSTNAGYMTGNALHKISDIAGLTTTIEYEPSVINIISKSGYPMFSGPVTIGLRIKDITSQDAVTGRHQKRSYEYSGAVCDIDLANISVLDYVSQSGTHSTYASDAGSSYSLGVTFTSSGTLQGRAVESSKIYYNRITEKLTGTGITHPLKTLREYSVSDLTTGISELKYYTDDDMPTLGPDAELGKRLGSLRNAIGGTPEERELLKPHYTRGYIRDSYGKTPLLKAQTEYEWRDGAYHPLLKTEYVYKEYDVSTVTDGLFCQSIVFAYIHEAGPPSKNISSFDDVNYFWTDIRSSRTLCESKSETKYFPDGNSRTVTTSFINHVSDTEWLNAPGFYCDSIKAPMGASFYPLGVITGCGNESVAKYTALSEYINTMNYKQFRLRGLRRLPVAEKYVYREGTTRDSLTKRWEYGIFNSLVLTAANRVETRNASRKADITVSEARFTGYDSHGRITAMRAPDGISSTVTWTELHDNPLKVSITGSPLWTSYSYQPLVGCTSSLLPTGKSTSYTYSGTRLSGIFNSSGKRLSAYSYSLYGDGSGEGRNRLSTTLYDSGPDSGTTESVTDSEMLDGFGKPYAVTETTPGNKFISTVTEYDAAGRVTKAYCPVTVSSSTDVPDDVEAAAAAQYGDSRAYTATEYMEAAGGPAIKITGAGENMLSHPVKSQYPCNNTSDPLLRCRKFDCSVSGRSEHIESDGYYAPGTLDVKSDTDPDGHRTLTFTDWRGLTIMQRRVLDSTTFADTYFFYDVRGQLRMVIQPEGVKNMPEWLDWSTDSPVIKKYGFIYRYDRRGNCTDVREPGGGWTETRYDRYNRPALRRTPSMAADSVAEFILYDAAGRETLRGLTGSWLASVETVFDATCSFTACGSGIAGSGYEVSDSAMMSLLSGARIINASYYDTYTAGDTEEFSALRSRGFTPDSVTSKGMLTARVTAVFGESGPADPVSWRRSLYGYDREGNCIREISDGSIAGSVLDTERGFTAQGYLTSEDVRVCAGDSVYTLVNRSYYSPKGAVRKQMASYSVSGASDQETGSWSMPYNAPACRTEYDPLGRVRKRISEIAAGMVSGCGVSVATSYTWNLRGQLTGVTSPAFSQTLNYDSGANPLYNGNIGSMTLSYGGEAVTRSYSYDGLNRLAESTSGDGFNTSYSYDLNSNPLDIERYGLTTVGVTGIVDDITMSYDGNRLSGGYDSAEEVLLENSSDMPPGEFSCEYDAEGRLIADSSRGISDITYSYSGMPLEITLDNGSRFQYRYTADDVRVRERYSGVPTITGRKKITSYTVRYFIGVMELEDFGFESKDIGWIPSPQVGSLSLDSSSATFPALPGSRLKPVMKRIALPWGYLDQHGARYTYINDHQGNVRAVVDQNGVAVQTTDYYPYGLPMATSTNPDVNRRKHTGKEYESRGGLNSYDFTARQYNPVTLRMDRIDPFSGKYHGFSPYVFCAANPILFSDPSGKDAQIIVDDNTITVRANIILTGDYATDELAKTYKAGIMETWGTIDKYTFNNNTYDVVWDVTVSVRTGKKIRTYNGVNNYMNVTNDAETSEVRDAKKGDIRAYGRNGLSLAEDNPMSHEFGHMLGLDDKYYYDSNGNFQYKDSKWKGDIMAEPTCEKNRIISNDTKSALFDKALIRAAQFPVCNFLRTHGLKDLFKPPKYQINKKNMENISTTN